jgi:hypothetical protein
MSNFVVNIAKMISEMELDKHKTPEQRANDFAKWATEQENKRFEETGEYSTSTHKYATEKEVNDGAWQIGE